MDKNEYAELRKIALRQLASLDGSDRSKIPNWKIHSYLKTEGYIKNNVYQLLEMSNQYVEMLEDISMPEDIVQLHSHNFYEIIWCRSENIHYSLGAEHFLLQPGDVVFIPPEVVHYPLALDRLTEPYCRYVMWLSAAFVQELGHSFPDLVDRLNLKQPYVLRTDKAIFHTWFSYFYEAKLAEQRHSPGWEAEICAQAILLLVSLFRFIANRSDSIAGAEKQDLFDKVLTYIEEHLSDKITLGMVAHNFFVSSRSISQLFQNRLNVSFYRYIIQRRLIAAKVLIQRNIPFEKVAIEVGFPDYSNFYRAFKKEYGSSPTKYKKLQAEKQKNRSCGLEQ